MLRIFSSSTCPISCLSFGADQIFRRKDKDIQQLNFFCALSPRRSEFSNTMQSLLLLLFLLLADFAFFIQTKEYTALCSLSPLPFFIITDFAFFPPAYLLAVSSQLYGLFRGFTKISTLLRIPIPDQRIVQRFCRGVHSIRLAQQKTDILMSFKSIEEC